MSELPQSLLASPIMGYAEHRIITDEHGNPLDYVFLDVNDTFERITGLSREQVLNKRVTEVIPVITEDPFNWIAFYGEIALGGAPHHFEQFSSALGRWYQVHAYSDKPLHFNTVFIDVSREKTVKQRQVEAQLSAVLDSTLDSIWSINTKYEIQYINAVFQRDFEQAFGIKLVPGTNLLTALPEFLRPHWKVRYDRGLAGERFIAEDVVSVNGGEIFLEVSANPIYEQDQITGVSFFSRNITDKKKAELALQESSSRLNSILLSINDVVWSLSLPDYRILFLSPKAEELYGRPIDDFFQNPDLWREAVHPDDLHTLDSTFAALFAQGYATRESRIIRPDGTVIWVLDKSTLVRDEHGEPIRIDGIVSDITARKLLEAERDESAQKLQQFSQHLPGVLYVYEQNADGTHRFPYTSRSLEHDYGATSAQAAESADYVFKAVHPDDVEKLQQSIAASAQNMKLWRATFRIINPQKKIMWVEGSAIPTKRDNGSINWYGYTQDITERKKAEYELERFKKIADKAVYGEAIADLNGRLIYINRFFAEVHGFSSDELKGGYMSVFHTPEQLQKVSELIRALIKNGTFEPTMVWHKHRNGTVFPMLMSGVLLRDDNGAPSYMAATAIDMTQQHEAEQLLSATRKQVTNISDNIPDGLVYQLVSRPGYRKFTYISAGVKKLHGLSVDEALQDPDKLYGQMHPEDAQEFAQKEQQSMDTLSVFQCEYRIHHPDGSIRWLYATSSPRLQPNGDILWDGIEIDITEKKKAEEEFVRLSQAVEQSPASVVITDVAGNITYVNPTFTELTGYSFQEALGQNPRILKSGNQPQSFYKELWDTIIGGRTWKGELLNHKKNGEPYWESATISPIKNEKGQITSFLAVKENITDRKHATEALRKSEEKYRVVADNTYHWEFWEAPTGELIYNSPACEKVTGYPPKAFEADPELLMQLIHPEDRGHYNKHRQKSWTEPAPDRCEFRLFHKNGGLRYIEHVCQPVFDTDGIFRGVRGTNVDITARKHIELQLTESEKRFREIFENMPVISVQGYNAQRQVIYWNDASEKLYGYSREEAMGEQLENLIIPEQDRETVISNINAWIESDQPIPSDELVLKRKDGGTAYVYSNHVMIRNMRGEPELYCIDLDLSELKRKEQELRQSEARYRSIIHVSNTGAWEFNTAQNTLWCSPEYFDMLGYTTEDFRTESLDVSSWINLVHPDDREEAAAKFETFIQEGMKHTYENYFRMLHKQGHAVWIWSRGQNLPSPDGQKSDVVLGVHIEITGIRNAEEKLRVSELYHRSLLQTIPDLVFVLDKNGTFSDFKSPSPEHLYVPPSQIIGSNVAEIMPSEVARQQMHTIGLALNEGGVHSFEYSLSMNGTQEYFSAATTAFGKDRVITTVRDITAFRQKLDEIKALLELEEKQTRSLREFTHIVSHNLRIHTANMLGIFMMLEMDEPQLYDLQYLQMLKESAENLEETITQLNKVLDIRLSSDVEWETINLSKLTDQVFHSVRQLADKTGVALINQTAPDTRARVVPEYMKSILLNLITNGIKFRSDERTSFVEISAKQENGFLTISVKDNGIGIDLHRHKSKLFGMYKKFHTDRDSKGLGLFITRNQAEAMGGHISVESTLNEGTTFTVRIPYGKNQGSLPH